MERSSVALLGRLGAVCAIVGLLVVAAPRPTAAYGPLAEYQVTLSYNCNNPDFCDGQLGGFWGWAEFDTDGHVDAQLTGCDHLQGGPGGGGGGAGHFSADAEEWFVAFSPDLGVNTFWVNDETDTFVGHGKPQTVFVGGPSDTGIPAEPGHYNTAMLLGFTPPPGVAFQVQVTEIPNR
jgi:hypothetical protein